MTRSSLFWSQAMPGSDAPTDSAEIKTDDGGFEADQVRRIERLPKEAGLLLMVAGVGGVLLPGPIGSPFLILGGLVLWPRAFRRVEARLARHFPTLHGQSVKQITRFLDDLDRRYPLPK